MLKRRRRQCYDFAPCGKAGGRPSVEPNAANNPGTEQMRDNGGGQGPAGAEESARSEGMGPT
eukprot:15443162-Alexandrium_andersonii.AAC.2